MSMKINVDLGSLRSSMTALGEQAEAAARPGAQAAAQVLYDEVRKNVAMLGRHTGNLERSIYQAFIADHSEPGRATYYVSWRSGRRGADRGLSGGGGLASAPHGHLVEFGYLQRYAYYQDEQGRVRPRVRPEMIGKPRPSSGSRNRAALDAYYVTLPAPKQVPGKSFVRRAESAFPTAIQAATDTLLRLMNTKGTA